MGLQKFVIYPTVTLFFSLVRCSIIYGLQRLVILRTCSFTTTKVCFEPKREYSISGTFVHFRELFTDFGFSYSCLKTIEQHDRLDSHELVFEFIKWVCTFHIQQHRDLTLFGWSTSTTICRRCRSRLVMNLRVLNVTTPSDCKQMED